MYARSYLNESVTTLDGNNRNRSTKQSLSLTIPKLR